MKSIQLIRIINIGIIEKLEIRLKRFNFAIGDNGFGKTTLKYALTFGMQGGNDSDVLRAGVDEGSVFFLFDDNASLEKVIVHGEESKLIFKDADGVPQKNVPTWLNAYRNIDSVDAASFLNIKKKEDQIKALLQAVTIILDEGRIAKIANGTDFERSTNPLLTLNSLKKTIFEKRTSVGGAEETNRTTAETMKAQLPPEYEVSPIAIIEELKSEKQQLEANYHKLRSMLETDRAETIARFENEQKDAIKASNDAHEKRCATADKQLEDAIQLLREQHRIKTAQWNSEQLLEVTRLSEPNPKITEARTEFDLQLSFNETAFNNAHEPLVARLAEGEEALRTFDMVEANRQTAKELMAKADKLKAQYDGLTASLDDLKLYYQEILDGIPIKGMDIRDGEIFLHDGKEFIPWDKVNTARKMLFFVDLAQLRSKKLKFISLDNTEAMTETTINEFMEAKKDEPFQFLFNRAMARVPLQVVSGDTREEVETKIEKIKADLVAA